MKGSKKHLLTLLDDPKFVRILSDLLAGTGASVSAGDACGPTGRGDTKEWYVRDFVQKFCGSWSDSAAFDGWWVPRPWRPPTWDLISTCTVHDRPGLLLVEAKAHESELKFRAKSLQPSASAGSKRNHEQIARRIKEAQEGLRRATGLRFNLSIDSPYQLANRVTYLWRLASTGTPTVLLYLGFTGDTEFKDGFLSADHWQRVMGGHIQNVLPHRFPEHWVKFDGGGAAVMSIRSLDIARIAPSRD